MKQKERECKERRGDSLVYFWLRAPCSATSYSSVSTLLMRYSLLCYRSTLLLVRNLSGHKGHVDNGV
jgi:hypothetical protein